METSMMKLSKGVSEKFFEQEKSDFQWDPSLLHRCSDKKALRFFSAEDVEGIGGQRPRREEQKKGIGEADSSWSRCTGLSEERRQFYRLIVTTQIKVSRGYDDKHWTQLSWRARDSSKSRQCVKEQPQPVQRKAS